MLIEKKIKQNLHRSFFQVIWFFFGIERRKKKDSEKYEWNNYIGLPHPCLYS